MKPDNNKEEFDFEIEDGDSSYRNAPMGIKELALDQFRECQKTGSKELHPGGIRKIIFNGNPQEIVEPDTGEIFCNAVKVLETTLVSHKRAKYKEMKSDWEDYENNLKKYNEMVKKFKEQIDNINKLPLYKKSKYNMSNMINEFERMKYFHKISLHRLLLEKLSILLSKNNYFNELTW